MIIYTIVHIVTGEFSPDWERTYDQAKDMLPSNEWMVCALTEEQVAEIYALNAPYFVG